MGVLTKRILGIAAVILMLVGAGAGTAWYITARNADPFRKAEALMARGDYPAARIELRVAIRAQPTNPAVRMALARVLSKLADPVAAEREYRSAATMGADKWDVWPELGEAMIVQGKFEEVLAQIPATAPDPAVAARDLALRAAAQLALKDVGAAQRSLDAVKRVAPDSMEAFLIAARLAAARDDLAGTEANIEAVLKRDPKQIEALLMREQLLTARKDYAGALDVANQAVAAAPWSAMARIDRAYQLMFNNEDDKAQADVDAVLANQPQFIDGVYLNGILMARRGNMEGAATQLTRLENAGSRFPQALLYLAKVSRAQGRQQAAAEQARRYNVLVPSDPDGVKILAQTALDIGKPALALPIVQAAVASGAPDAEMLDIAGRLYVATSDATAAYTAFQRAAAAAPKDAGIQANFGMALMRRGDVAAAISALENAVRLDPRLDEATQSLILAYTRLGQTGKAQAALDTLRRNTGETAVVGILTSELQARQGDEGAARATLLTTLRTFPGSTPAKIALARLYGREGSSREAIRLYNEVLAKQPANIEALQPLLPMLVQSGQAAAAVGVLEAARKAEPAVAGLSAMLADAYTATGKPDQALALLDEAQQAQGPRPVLMGPLARAQVAAGFNDQAKQTYAAILQNRPTDLAIRLDQVVFLAKREPAAAEASLRDAVAAAPGDLIPMTDLVSFVNATRGEQAATQVVQELKATPANMPFAGALLGDMLMRANRYADAATAYETEFRALPSQPLLLRYATAAALSGHDDTATLALRAWLQANPGAVAVAATLARLDISAKRWQEAETLVTAALEKAPNDALILASLARIYLGKNDKRALDVAQRAYMITPSAQTGDTLGWVSTWQQDVKVAIPMLRLASQQSPADLSIRYHLAVALNKDGQRDQAVAILREVAKATQPFDERQDANALLKQLQAP